VFELLAFDLASSRFPSEIATTDFFNSSPPKYKYADVEISGNNNKKTPRVIIKIKADRNGRSSIFLVDINWLMLKTQR